MFIYKCSMTDRPTDQAFNMLNVLWQGESAQKKISLLSKIIYQEMSPIAEDILKICLNKETSHHCKKGKIK